MCPLCHFAIQSTLIQVWFQGNLLLLPTVSWPSQSSLLLQYIKAVEFFISAVDALVVSRNTVSLCPLNHSSLSHLSLGLGLGDVGGVHTFSFWFLPSYIKVLLRFSSRLIYVPTVFYSYVGEKIVRFPLTALSMLSYMTSSSKYGKNNQCGWSIL